MNLNSEKLLAKIIWVIVYPLSILPFKVLYLISDLLFLLIYYVIQYRRKVVNQNLRMAFPEKTASEISNIEHKFYRYFCDLLVETLKSFTISQKELLKRMEVGNIDLINNWYEKGKSVIIITAHYGNWEWVGMYNGLHFRHKPIAIYKRLKNKGFDYLIKRTRERFGLQLTPHKLAKRTVMNSEVLTMTGMIADQTPSNTRKSPWMIFMQQPTAVFRGAEDFARDFNSPVFFGNVDRIARGKYFLSFTELSANPAEEQPGIISYRFMKHLEQLIHKKPEIWLWTHKRWKHKPPEGVSFLDF